MVHLAVKKPLDLKKRLGVSMDAFFAYLYAFVTPEKQNLNDLIQVFVEIRSVELPSLNLA